MTPRLEQFIRKERKRLWEPSMIISGLWVTSTTFDKILRGVPGRFRTQHISFDEIKTLVLLYLITRGKK